MSPKVLLKSNSHLRRFQRACRASGWSCFRGVFAFAFSRGEFVGIKIVLERIFVSAFSVAQGVSGAAEFAGDLNGGLAGISQHFDGEFLEFFLVWFGGFYRGAVYMFFPTPSALRKKLQAHTNFENQATCGYSATHGRLVPTDFYLWLPSEFESY